jgi:hypothetical protein
MIDTDQRKTKGPGHYLSSRIGGAVRERANADRVSRPVMLF